MESDKDTALAIENLRRDQGLGVSEAVNELILRGLVAQQPRTRFGQRTAPLSLSLDVSSVADALEVLDGTSTR